MYKFKYRKWLFWKIREVVGHRLDKELDRMDLYFPDGSIMSIGNWSKCDLFLGTDWVLFTKKQMEKELGQDIKLNQE